MIWEYRFILFGVDTDVPIAPEQGPTDDNLKDDAAESKDIGSVIEIPQLNDFGRSIAVGTAAFVGCDAAFGCSIGGRSEICQLPQPVFLGVEY